MNNDTLVVQAGWNRVIIAHTLNASDGNGFSFHLRWICQDRVRCRPVECQRVRMDPEIPLVAVCRYRTKGTKSPIVLEQIFADDNLCDSWNH